MYQTFTSDSWYINNGASVTSSSYCKQAVRTLLLHSSHSEEHSSHHCFTSADQVISRTRDHLQYFYHLSMQCVKNVPRPQGEKL